MLPSSASHFIAKQSQAPKDLNPIRQEAFPKALLEPWIALFCSLVGLSNIAEPKVQVRPATAWSSRLLCSETAAEQAFQLHIVRLCSYVGTDVSAACPRATRTVLIAPSVMPQSRRNHSAVQFKELYQAHFAVSPLSDSVDVAALRQEAVQQQSIRAAKQAAEAEHCHADAAFCLQQ